MADLLDSAFSTNATTVDMGLGARTLLVMGEATALKANSLSLTCQQYAQGFTPAEGKASLLGGALVLDAPGCTRYRVEMPQGEPLLSLLVTTEGFDRAVMSDASNGISLQRRYLDSKGEAITTARLGDVITVELAVQASGEINNVVLLDLLPGGFEPMAFFIRAPGAFLVLAVLVAILNAVGIKNRSRKMVEGCDGCCANCTADCDKKEEAEQ